MQFDRRAVRADYPETALQSARHSRANLAPMTGVVNTDGGLGVRGFSKMAGGENL